MEQCRSEFHEFITSDASVIATVLELEDAEGSPME